MQTIGETRTEKRAGVCGGVDTHRDIHVAAAIDPTGRLLGTESFPVNPAGYTQMCRWLRSHGACGARRGGRHRQLRRRAVTPSHQTGTGGSGGQPTQPPAPQTQRQNRHRRRLRCGVRDRQRRSRRHPGKPPTAPWKRSATCTWDMNPRSRPEPAQPTSSKRSSSQLQRPYAANWAANPPQRWSRHAPDADHPAAAMWRRATAKQP